MSRASSLPWQRIGTIYVLVQFAEIFGVAMIYAYLPLALERAGVPLASIASVAGATTAGIFIVGAPQVPIWLAIAELRSRRLVIVRSGLIALVALIAFALAQEAWQLIGATLALGFWLGNTGVMLATIREVSPEHARTRSIALFSAAAPMGFALGPLLAGAMIDGLGLSLAAPIMVAALLNAALIVANIVAIPDVRPHHPPTGGVLEVARRGLSEVFADRRIRAGYLVLGLAIAGERMLRPVFPLRIAEVVIGPSITGIAEPLAAPGVAGAIGLLTGLSALGGALLAPLLATRLVPRMGIPRVMVLSFAAAAVAAGAMIVVSTALGLALSNTLLAAASALLQAMVFTWLANSVTEHRRTAALSLSLFPLYAGAVVGPLISSAAALISTPRPGDALALTPIFLGSVLLLALGIVAVRRLPAGDHNAR
ncbi:MAG: MFS transporter [Chloroflexi bacterium]|nr:MFS transporter [Chloroflexota bacterium]